MGRARFNAEPAWQHLVQEVHPLRDTESFGRSQVWPRSGHSIRLRNRGKWGVRWDREAELLVYMQMPVGHRVWQALAGGHRLGWGNRT